MVVAWFIWGFKRLKTAYLTPFADPATIAAMLAIRLQRVGRKNEPVFRVVLTDSKNGPKSGKFLEILGSYDSRHSEKAEVKADRIKHLVANGAKLSGTLHNLLISKKLITGKKVNVLPKKRPIAKEGAEATATGSVPSVEVKADSPVEAPAETPSPEAKVEEAATA